MHGQLMGAAMYAIGCAAWFADWVQDMRKHAPVNAFHLPSEEQHRLVGGDPNIRIWLGLWELAPDEALVIEATPPRCDYWNFQLGNIWAESLDYQFRRVHINSGQAVLRPDGSFELVVAAPRPRPSQLDRHRRARPRHHVRALGARRFASRAALPRDQALGARRTA